ncbi:MAG: flagellar accessory protein FlaH [Chloroflexi bacterium]|nr:flagellar accessory protein FlaH [Chloroflexota bacterium]
MAKQSQREAEEKGKDGVIRLGKPEMDNKMGGGIPAGSLVLVEGQSDSGKSVIVQHFIEGALQAELNVAAYTNENTVKSLIRQMESLGMDVLDYFLLGNLTILPLDGLEEGETPESQFARLAEHLTELPLDCTVVSLDSITNLVTHADEGKVIDFFTRCKKICDMGRTMFLVVHSSAFSEEMFVRVRSLCDAHFSLKITYVGDRMVKMLEVAKVRGAERSTGNVITFDIEPNLGVKPIPIVMAKA